MPTSNPEQVKILNDEDYFATIDTEQKNWYKKHGPEIQSLHSDDTVNCSSCNKQIQIQVLKKILSSTREPSSYLFLKNYNAKFFQYFSINRLAPQMV